jgi:hypothetical protein
MSSTEDKKPHIEAVAREALSTFESVATDAAEALRNPVEGLGANSLANVNTLTDGGAVAESPANHRGEPEESGSPGA